MSPPASTSPATTSATMPGLSAQWTTRSRPSVVTRSTPRIPSSEPYSTGLRNAATMRRVPSREETKLSGVPSATILPRYKNATRSHMASTSSTWLLGTSTATPAAASSRIFAW
jgi:hypothetical protein